MKQPPLAIQALRVLSGRSLVDDVRETRICKSTLCEIYGGVREPSPVHRRAIERLYGFPWDLLRQTVTPRHLIILGSAP